MGEKIQDLKSYISLLIPRFSPLPPVIQPSHHRIEFEVELVKSYWGIWITVHVWQPSLFWLPKTGSACEKIFSQNQQGDLLATGLKWTLSQTFQAHYFVLFFLLLLFFFCCNCPICLQIARGLFLFDILTYFRHTQTALCRFCCGGNHLESPRG